MYKVHHDREVFQQTSMMVAKAEYGKLTFFTFSMKSREQIGSRVRPYFLKTLSKEHVYWAIFPSEAFSNSTTSWEPML